MQSSSNTLITNLLNDDRDREIYSLKLIHENANQDYKLAQQYFITTNNAENDKRWIQCLAITLKNAIHVSDGLKKYVHPENEFDNCSKELQILYLKHQLLITRIDKDVYQYHPSFAGRIEVLKKIITTAENAFFYFTQNLNNHNDDVEIELLENLFTVYEIIAEHARSRDITLKNKLNFYRSILFYTAKHYLDKHRHATDMVLVNMMFPYLMIELEKYTSESYEMESDFKDLCTLIHKKNMPLQSARINNYLL